MDLQLAGKNVLYTGAAGLIGKACCLALAKEGAHLTLLDPNAEGLRVLCEDISEQAPESRVLCFSEFNSLSGPEVDAILRRSEEELGPIQALVNSAYPRTSDWHKPFEEIPYPSWSKNVDDHLGGYFLMCQRVALLMRERRAGSIVNFGSTYGLVGPDFTVYEGLDKMTMPAAYSAIKGGIVNFTRYLAAYLGPHGVRANVLCPGGVFDSQPPLFVERYEKKVPMRRMATPADLVGPLLFLVSEMSQYVTGVVLCADGGWTAI